MPSPHADYVAYIAQDVLGELEVTSRRMFGGHGLYHAGIMFGLEANGAIYFKVDATNQGDYERAESSPFQYSSKDKKAVTMSYWRVPDEVLERREEAVAWARKAIAVSQAMKRKK